MPIGYPILTLCALTLLFAVAAAEPDDYRANAHAFIAEMADKHGIEAAVLEHLLDQAEYRQPIIDAMNRPYEEKSWRDYRRIFVTPERIEGGIDFWREHADILSRAETAHGVSPEIIVAIIGVETNYGGNSGTHRVLDALTTLGFSYPRRADFFRKELEEFILLSREEGIDPVATRGSYAGAMGKPQFIASSYRAYALDFDGDGRRDLWNSSPDVIASVANYFQRHGWRAGEAVAFQLHRGPDATPGFDVADKQPLAPGIAMSDLLERGIQPHGTLDPSTRVTLIRLDGDTPEYWIGLDNFYVITRYNHSNLYAMAVHQLSQEIRAGFSSAAP